MPWYLPQSLRQGTKIIVCTSKQHHQDMESTERGFAAHTNTDEKPPPGLGRRVARTCTEHQTAGIRRGSAEGFWWQYMRKQG